MKQLTFLLTTFLLLNIINNYSFIPKAGPSTRYGFLEIVPENDSIIKENKDVAYYMLKCDRKKMNVVKDTEISTTKDIVNERLQYPNLRRSYEVEFPGADARYDYLCKSVTVSKTGIETTSILNTLKVGGPPSEVSVLDFQYNYQTTMFEVNYSIPDKRGSPLKYIDIYLRTKDGSYKRICRQTGKQLEDTKCSVSSYLLMDNPFNLTTDDLLSVYLISENAFGKSKITYSLNPNNLRASTPPVSPVLAPAEATVLTSENQIVINITPVAGATSYKLFYQKTAVKNTDLAFDKYIELTTTTYVFNKFDLNLGDTYLFKYVAINQFGPSKDSPITTVTVASAPDRMLPPILTYSVENSGSVKIRMLNSADNGSPITSYNLKIMSVQGDLVELPWCNNSETECQYPSYVLKDSPFYLEEGHFIYASSANMNSKGLSEYSSLSEGLELKGAPKSPPNPPYSGSNTNRYQISVKVDELSEEYAGKEEVLSYNVVAMIGENNYISLAGADNQTPYTDTNREILFYDVKYGSTYKFLYRVKNAFGWSSFSEIGYITVPES
ncbi:MAG: hypothetical protein ACK5YA_00675 [bacterium]